MTHIDLPKFRTDCESEVRRLLLLRAAFGRPDLSPSGGQYLQSQMRVAAEAVCGKADLAYALIARNEERAAAGQFASVDATVFRGPLVAGVNL